MGQAEVERLVKNRLAVLRQAEEVSAPRKQAYQFTATDDCTRLRAPRIYLALNQHEADRGGHFAAWEEPHLFSEEVRAAFRPLREMAGSTEEG